MAQRLDGFLAFGEGQYLGFHPEAFRHQAQVVGADALVAIAVDGDVHRLVIGKRDAHPQHPRRPQPLLLRVAQGQRLKLGERRRQGKGQTLRGLHHVPHT
ncbi:hypothetical protein D3C76_1340390 [compost metagenome]